MNRRELIDGIIEREGGFVNDPADPGGATNMGITLANFRKWLGVDAPASRLKALTREDAHSFYNWYFASKGVDRFPGTVLEHILDLATLHGGWRSIVSDVADLLESDPYLVKACDAYGPDVVNALLVARRAQYVTELADRKPALRKFHRGWMNRVVKFNPTW